MRKVIWLALRTSCGKRDSEMLPVNGALVGTKSVNFTIVVGTYDLYGCYITLDLN